MSCGRQAERAGARLIDLEPDRGHLLAPVEMRIDQPPIGAHDVAHLRGDVAHHVGLCADDPELHGKADRRPEIEPVEPHARLRSARPCRPQPRSAP